MIIQFDIVSEKPRKGNLIYLLLQPMNVLWLEQMSKLLLGPACSTYFLMNRLRWDANRQEFYFHSKPSSEWIHTLCVMMIACVIHFQTNDHKIPSRKKTRMNQRIKFFSRRTTTIVGASAKPKNRRQGSPSRHMIAFWFFTAFCRFLVNKLCKSIKGKRPQTLYYMRLDLVCAVYISLAMPACCLCFVFYFVLLLYATFVQMIAKKLKYLFHLVIRPRASEIFSITCWKPWLIDSFFLSSHLYKAGTYTLFLNHQFAIAWAVYTFT